MASLRDCFLRANTANLNYVVLNDDRCLPEYLPTDETEIRILVDQDHRKPLIHAFQMEAKSPALREKSEMFIIPELLFHVRLLTKGRGYFPETFESKLLAKRHIVNHCIPVVSFEDRLWAALYEHLNHNMALNTRMRLILVSAVSERVGKAIYRNPHNTKAGKPKVGSNA